MSGATADVSFLVVTVRGGPRLARCLASIRATIDASGRSAEIVVVANGRGAQRLLAASPPDGVDVIASRVNLGFAGGLVLARRRATGTFLAVVQDDAELSVNWLTGSLAALRSDPALGAVGGRVESFDGALLHAGWVLDGQVYRTAKQEVVARAERQPAPQRVELINSAAMLVVADAWDRSGGPDPRLFPVSYVDYDLCLRMLVAGWCVAVEPDVMVRHQTQGSMRGHRRRYADRRNERKWRRRWAAQLSTLPKAPSPWPTRPPADRRTTIDTGLERAARTPHPFADPGRRTEAPPTPSGLRAEIDAVARLARFRAGAEVFRVTSWLKDRARPRLGPVAARLRGRKDAVTGK